MDFESQSQLQYRLRLNITYQRRFLRNIVMSAIANDPHIDEASKARVKSLPIAESESDDFATRLGMFIVRQLLKIRLHTDEHVTRSIIRHLITVSCTLDEFFSYFNYYVNKACECGEWFKAEEPRRYLHFVIIICEFCCRVAEMDEIERYFSMIFQWVEDYINLFQEAEELSDEDLSDEEINDEEITEDELIDSEEEDL